MICAENMVYTAIYDAVIAYDPTADVDSVYVEVPAAFPHVSCVEVDNATYKLTSDLDRRENHARVLYQIDIYSNKLKTAKSECKAILAVVDETMLGLGFTRISASQLPNVDRSLYRMTARYEAVVGETTDSQGNKTVYVYLS